MSAAIDILTRPSITGRHSWMRCARIAAAYHAAAAPRAEVSCTCRLIVQHGRVLGIDAQALAGAFIREVSQRWAVCDDWGDLQRIWVMRIPAQGTLHAYFGFAKFQPKTSRQAEQRHGQVVTNFYEGGSIQLVTRVGLLEKSWIRGPFRSLDFSLAKLHTA